MASKSQTDSVPANQTLYIQNLAEKLPKADLRRQLYMLFSTYGSVLSIVALKTSKMRGQAHITFKDIQTATQAMRNLEGFEFFGRPLRISYAKSKSDFIAKLDGSFKMPETAQARAAAESAVGDKGTALQQSVFGGALPASTTSTSAAPAQGLKRAREDEDDEGAPMEEDEEDMEMDESDDE